MSDKSFELRRAGSDAGRQLGQRDCRRDPDARGGLAVQGLVTLGVAGPCHRRVVAPRNQQFVQKSFSDSTEKAESDSTDAVGC